MNHSWKMCLALAIVFGSWSVARAETSSAKDDGYRGIWFTLGQFSEYGDKYSGGLGTYTAHHVPMGVYSEKARKTFFVYGGAKEGKRHLLAMASYYDHERRVVPRPTIVHDKQKVNDPHDDPSICLDPQGYVWVFVSGRARQRPGFVYRSTEPYSVDKFEQVGKWEFTYPQPHWIDGQGFFFLFTQYTSGRELYWATSPDGRKWSTPEKFAGMGGHYQTSAQRGNHIVTAFNMHPGGNVDKRTNLYCVQSDDMGRTWHSVDGKSLSLPLSKPDSPALVHDYRADKRLVYVQDTTFDEQGRPVLMFITSSNYAPGPAGDPRIWTLAHWTGERWEFLEVTRSDHNYDMGSLYIEGDGQWRIIGPTDPGPQPYGTGGEMVLWVSKDQGKTWNRQRQITHDSRRNHSYARRPLNAHPDFYAFWADGDPRKMSESHLYFTNRSGDQVWELPYSMDGELASPKPLYGK